MGVVAPGTGLGEAFLLWTGGALTGPLRPRADMPTSRPTRRWSSDLLKPISRDRQGHVSYEDVCSGRGPPNLYAFLRDSGRHAEPEWLRTEGLAQRRPDPTRAIVRARRRGAGRKVAVAAFGAVARHPGGPRPVTWRSACWPAAASFWGGGLPPRLLKFLQADAFLRAFSDKSRFSDFLKRTPLHVIRHPQAALLGAACHGLELEGYHALNRLSRSL
ncbi:MAG: glucokinase [Anaerolineae bacterium]